MIVYDMLKGSQYDQKFYIYVTNAWDKNLPIFKGCKCDFIEPAIDYDNWEFFDHLPDKIDVYMVCKDGGILIKCIDENFNTPIEKLYSESQVAKWNNEKPETRPWRWGSELEC